MWPCNKRTFLQRDVERKTSMTELLLGMSTGQGLSEDILPLLAPSSKVFPIPIPGFGEYSSFILIPAVPAEIHQPEKSIKFLLFSIKLVVKK
jgi:hypothetical protein